MAQINFGGVLENVVTREEFTLAKAREVLKTETVAVIGYGVQGPGQSLNLKDNGINVIVGQRKGGKSWNKALADGTGLLPGVDGSSACSSSARAARADRAYERYPRASGPPDNHISVRLGKRAWV